MTVTPQGIGAEMSDKQWYAARDRLKAKYGHVCDAMFASMAYGQFAWNKNEAAFLGMPKPQREITRDRWHLLAAIVYNFVCIPLVVFLIMGGQ